MRSTIISIVFISLVNLIYSQTCHTICNGGFDSVLVAGTTVAVTDASNVPCWKTTSTDNKIEVWANGYNGINSYSGIQFIEVNATMPCTVYQDFTTSAGSLLTINFAHRARGNSGVIDSILVSIGPQSGPFTTLGRFGDGTSSWIYRTLNYTVPSGYGNNFSLKFTSLYVGNGNSAIGNFLDAVNVCESPLSVEEITNNSIFKISPNPSHSGYFKMTLSDNNLIGEPLILSIFDTTGKLLREEFLIINNTESIINIDNIPSGLYYIKAKTGKQVFNNKLLINN